MKYKVGVENFTIVRYCGSNIVISCGPYWTTVEANSESEAKINAKHNLLVKIAMGEIFTWGNVKRWVNIGLDYCDMVVSQ